MIASNEERNSELRLNVLDQIIQLFDYIIIYCSSLTIEHSNSRWGFKLTIWLYKLNMLTDDLSSQVTVSYGSSVMSRMNYNLACLLLFL